MAGGIARRIQESWKLGVNARKLSCSTSFVTHYGGTWSDSFLPIVFDCCPAYALRHTLRRIMYLLRLVYPMSIRAFQPRRGTVELSNRLVTANCPDQMANFRRNARAPRLAAADVASPEETEAFWVAGDQPPFHIKGAGIPGSRPRSALLVLHTLLTEGQPRVSANPRFPCPSMRYTVFPVRALGWRGYI